MKRVAAGVFCLTGKPAYTVSGAVIIFRKARNSRQAGNMDDLLVELYSEFYLVGMQAGDAKGRHVVDGFHIFLRDGEIEDIRIFCDAGRRD